MKVEINIGTLGRGQLWNHCTERYDIMGLVCKEAGLEDDDMDHRMCVILKKNPKEEENTRTLPDELFPFFVEVKSWKPISLHYEGSLKFAPNELGLKIAGLNDALVSTLDELNLKTKNDEDVARTAENVKDLVKQIVAALFEGDVGVDWNVPDICIT